MGVAELGGDVQPEVARPVQLFVAELNHVAVTLLYDGLGQYRLNGWVELLKHVLRDTR